MNKSNEMHKIQSLIFGVRAGAMIVLLLLLFSRQSSAQEIKAIKVTELEKFIKETTRPTLINFWATWCRPCIEEIPYFQQIVKTFEKDSVDLILVSVDYKEEFPAGITSAVNKRNFTVPVFWLNETNAD